MALRSEWTSDALVTGQVGAMTGDRKHPSAAFWITVAMVVALVGYPLSWAHAIG